MIHQFGGDWTEEKLERLRKYLAAYMRIFSKNERARKLSTIYVDAFAGTGSRVAHSTAVDALPSLFGDADATAFQRGSVRIALETNPPFDRYLFIEQNPAYARELHALLEELPELAPRIRIEAGEANGTLRAWAKETDWSNHRAVAFLDPYGMDIEWSTLASLAETRAVDLWVLFPLGQAVNRLLTRKAPPEGTWADKLTRFFGTEAWKTTFYSVSPQVSLFDGEERLEKNADFDKIGAFFLDRLGTIFAGVARNALPLTNSKGIPIYLLCFAAANPRGAKTATTIANDLLRPRWQPKRRSSGRT